MYNSINIILYVSNKGDVKILQTAKSKEKANKKGFEKHKNL